MCLFNVGIQKKTENNLSTYKYWSKKKMAFEWSAEKKAFVVKVLPLQKSTYK